MNTDIFLGRLEITHGREVGFVVLVGPALDDFASVQPVSLVAGEPPEEPFNLSQEGLEEFLSGDVEAVVIHIGVGKDEI
jgi:hypothetical protein